MSWALGRWRARRCPRLPAPRRGLARRRGEEAEEGAGPIPFSASEASPRVWSVRRSMGSDHERPWVKVLPVSLVCGGLLLWCAFRDRTDIDERLEAAFSGLTADSLDAARESGAPLQPRKEN
ncbi:ubiquinol-cytochrome c reductase complex assembly factor 4 [Athene noctua]|uniref:ubiquinol-cytochrome c reductase complex assembly factor 4 n=1 Tax=Athene noctua TaxID=126797 RepID=UPI003EBCA117